MSSGTVSRCSILNVERGDHGDSRVKQHFDVLPTFRVGTARDVAVRVFVDQRYRRAALQHRLDIELEELRAAIGQLAPRNDFDAVEELGDLLAAVRFNYRCDDVGAAALPAMRLAKHGAGLADAGCRAEVDAQVTTPARLRLLGGGVGCRLRIGSHSNIIYDFTG
jgi:hypothetical protein